MVSAVLIKSGSINYISWVIISLGKMSTQNAAIVTIKWTPYLPAPCFIMHTGAVQKYVFSSKLHTILFETHALNLLPCLPRKTSPPSPPFDSELAELQSSPDSIVIYATM